jgi:hypothetical protein
MAVFREKPGFGFPDCKPYFTIDCEQRKNINRKERYQTGPKINYLVNSTTYRMFPDLA